MIRIVLIAYSQALSDLFAATLAEHNQQPKKHPYLQDDYRLETIRAHDPSELKERHLDADVLVARSFMAEALQQWEYYVPVVEIPVAINDLLRCVHQARQLPGSHRMAVIGSRSMTMGVDQLNEMSGVQLHPFTLESRQEIEAQVQFAATMGFTVVIGGVRSCEVAARCGLIPIFIEASKESIWHTITEAKHVAYISRQERQKAQSITRILDQAFDGIIALDPQHRITLFSASAERLLGLTASEVLGCTLANVLPNSQLLELLQQREPTTGAIVKHNGRYLAINLGVIELEGEQLGALLTLHDAQHIQKIEGKIRHEMCARGHVAKHEFSDIIGISTAIRHVVQVAMEFSAIESHVLIIGKTGTGKELFAQSIHNQSPRRRGPFVAINCAALSESLLESELFGYATGAFTGAAKDGKPGLFELAHRGTIFLDEISEISPRLQVLLLRILQEKEVMRLGDNKVMPVDVRVIASTNKDLAPLVAEKRFREDLYYRLDILRLYLPNLDVRKEDIPLIAEHWIRTYSAQLKHETPQLTDSAVRLLQAQEWPGNVRQLRNVCERLAVLSKSPLIDELDVENALAKTHEIVDMRERHSPAPLSRASQSANDVLREVRAEERDQVLDALRRARFSRTQTANMLKVSRTTLWRKMKALEIPGRQALERLKP